MKLEEKLEYYGGERGDFLAVDKARCNACGACLKFCARGVWEKEGGVFKPAHPERCAECGACWNVCPADAVLLNEPRGGTGVAFTFG